MAASTEPWLEIQSATVRTMLGVASRSHEIASRSYHGSVSLEDSPRQRSLSSTLPSRTSMPAWASIHLGDHGAVPLSARRFFWGLGDRDLATWPDRGRARPQKDSSSHRQAAGRSSLVSGPRFLGATRRNSTQLCGEMRFRFLPQRAPSPPEESAGVHRLPTATPEDPQDLSAIAVVLLQPEHQITATRASLTGPLVASDNASLHGLDDLVVVRMMLERIAFVLTSSNERAGFPPRAGVPRSVRRRVTRTTPYSASPPPHH